MQDNVVFAPPGYVWEFGPADADGRATARAVPALSAGSSEPTREMIEAGIDKLHETIDLSKELLEDMADDFPRIVGSIYLAMEAARQRGGE